MSFTLGNGHPGTALYLKRLVSSVLLKRSGIEAHRQGRFLERRFPSDPVLVVIHLFNQYCACFVSGPGLGADPPPIQLAVYWGDGCLDT